MTPATVVVVTEAGTRILKGVDPLDWEGNPEAVINPDLSGVAGFPPHLWRIHQGQLAVVLGEEQAARHARVMELSREKSPLSALASSIQKKELISIKELSEENDALKKQLQRVAMITNFIIGVVTIILIYLGTR